MEYRKLIKFGESSHVISLPMEWVRKNNLKKGDLIYFEQNGNSEIVLTPNKQEKAKIEKEILINVDGKEQKYLQREITSAYLNNYSTFKFEGNQIAKKSEQLRELVQSLVALEIVEQTNKNIIVKDFLDIETVAVDSLIRRIDILVRAVFLDMLDIIKGEERVSFGQKEHDINKLSFLAIKAIRYYFENTNKTNNYLELASNLQIINSIENLADEIKRFCRMFLNVKLDEKSILKIKQILDKANANYAETMKAYYNRDKHLAYELAAYRKDDLISECEDLLKKQKNDFKISTVIDKMKAIIVNTHEIGRAIYV